MCNWCTVYSKGCGRNGGDIIYDTILTFAWKDWNTSVRIADLRPRFDSRRVQYEAKCFLLDQEAQCALLLLPIIIIIIIIIIWGSLFPVLANCFPTVFSKAAEL